MLHQTCMKCGNKSGEWILSDDPLFLCTDCQTDFSIWTIVMDDKFVSYSYTEFLEAA